MAEQRSSCFESVFQKHFEAVYGYVAFRLVPEMQDVPDLTQEVFMAALETWSNFRGETTPLQWLRSIARRKVADYFAAKRPLQALGVISPVAPTPANDPADRTELLAAALRLLPPDYAELLEEKYLEGMSVRQIAQKRDRSEKSVESGLSRARAALREAYLRLDARQEAHHEPQ